MQDLAKVLGILLGDCQVGSRRQVVKQEKKEHVEDPVEEQLEGTVKEEIVEQIKGLNVYSCNECGKQFRRKSHLIRHKLRHKEKSVLTQYSGDILTCHQCPQTCNGKKYLAKHMLRVHGTVKTNPCDYCERKFARIDYLSKHVNDVHNVHNGTMNETSMNEIKENDPDRQYKCDNCETTFKTKNHRRRHNASIHTNIIISCSDCKKQFSRRDKLNAHRKMKHEIVNTLRR